VTFLSLEASGRRFGRYVWAERCLFEVLGAWSGDTADPAVRPVLAANAAHHAWRAGVLADRLPHARGLDTEGWIGPPSEPVAAAFASLAEPGPEQTAARLAGVYDVVVPHLVAAYLDHVGRARAISDAPSIRWLKLVVRDEIADRRRALRCRPARADAEADALCRRISGLLAEGGGIAGERDRARPVHHATGDEQSSTTLLPSTRNHE
jgi:hypothetical protein